MGRLKRFKAILIFSTCGAFGFFWHGLILPAIIRRIWFGRRGVTYGDGDLIPDRKCNSWDTDVRD